ncbi:MAG: BACON domain-containing protein [Synergistaceae bacterium]|nr:BACON domain-containing protein [Synergistaceae bacterium]
MKHRFIVPALLLCLTVSVLSLVGCGGGGSKNRPSAYYEQKEEEQEQKEDTAALKQKEREDYSNALSAFYERLKAEGTYDKFISACDYIIISNPTGRFIILPEHNSDKIVSGPLEDAAEVITEVVKPRYDNGQIIYMLSPTQDDLDILLRGIGETSPYTEPANSDEPIYALYAIAKRYASNGTKHVFTHKIPCQVHFTSEVAEYESKSRDVPVYDREKLSEKFSSLPVSDDETSEQENTNEIAEKIGFINQCIIDFGEWALNYIDNYVETAGLTAAEFSSQVNAAIDGGDLEDLASARHERINLSYEKAFHPFSNGTYDHTANRKSSATYHIYSCHSFSTGSDFYLIKCDVSSTPDVVYDYNRRNYDDGSPAYYTEYYGGATDHIFVGTYMKGDENSNSNAVLVKTVPFATVPMNTTHTEHMSWSQGGKIGLGISSSGPSIGLDLTETVTHDKTMTYTTTDWKLDNTRDNERINDACFDLDVKGASITEYDVNDEVGHTSDHGTFNDFDIWDIVTLPDAAKKELHFTFEWVWEVKKQFWQSREYIPFMGYAEFTDLFVHGAGLCIRANMFYKDHSGGSEKTKIKTRIEPQEIPHDAPSHIYVSKTSYIFGTVGGVSHFDILCNGNWKVQSDSDWCVIPKEEQSGSDTGAQATVVTFKVSPYSGDTSTYDARKAIITATEIRPDGSTGDTIKIEVNQNNH